MKTFTHLHVVPVLTALVLMTTVPLVSQAADYPAPGNFQQGAKTWSENCGRCHNIRGPRELRDDQWISTVFHMRVRAGLTGQESRDVLTFLQGSNTQSPGTVTPVTLSKPAAAVSGQGIYTQTCVACHGIDGSGGLPGLPDFTGKNSPLLKSDATLLKHILEGFQSPGSPMAMLAKGGNPDLSAEDIQAVLGYIRETFGQ
jgi:mono/diheme cytochrome c family protein